MKYYRDEVTGDVYAFESDGSQDSFIGDDMVLMTDEEVEAHINPQPYIPTYQEELAALNKKYQEDVEAFNKAFSLAIMFDGVNEEVKKVTIREQYAARKNKYVADMGILRIKHGV